jgi:hypothetical protein
MMTDQSTENDRQNRRDAGCKTLHVEVGPRHTSWCQGSPPIHPLLRRLDVPTMYDRDRRAWAVPTNRLDDVLVAAEHTERRFVTVEADGQ